MIPDFSSSVSNHNIASVNTETGNSIVNSMPLHRPRDASFVCHELNNNLGIFDDISEKKNNDKNDNYVGVKGDIHAYGLIDKYTEKAQNIKKTKNKKKK